MGSIQIKILDVSGSRSRVADVPGDVPIDRLLLLLVERMNLPLNSPDGQLMVYKLHHKRSGRQLLDTETLTQAGVQDGEELRLQPEIIAG
ncbi:MAG: EsaB/YukD family protein [Armatimonadetes bacterium]|nr:EsaB/YukD family protein [Armatimonadota bacterium]